MTRIVVADQGEARFYDRAGSGLRAVGSLENPAASAARASTRQSSVDQVETMLRDAKDLLSAVRESFPELSLK